MAPLSHRESPLAFGRALRRRRTHAALSQEQLGLRAGVDRVYISELERGIKCPTLGTIARLARALEMRPSHLVRVAESLADVGQARRDGEAGPWGRMKR
ncbi:MAG: helix-turn-helix transcriptional regulator [Planctomycetota bacterium]